METATCAVERRSAGGCPGRACAHRRKVGARGASGARRRCRTQPRRRRIARCRGRPARNAARRASSRFCRSAEGRRSLRSRAGSERAAAAFRGLASLSSRWTATGAPIGSCRIHGLAAYSSPRASGSNLGRIDYRLCRAPADRARQGDRRRHDAGARRAGADRNRAEARRAPSAAATDQPQRRNAFAVALGFLIEVLGSAVLIGLAGLGGWTLENIAPLLAHHGVIR